MSKESLMSGRVIALLSSSKRAAKAIGVMLTMSMLAAPALAQTTSMSDVVWIAHWLDDGNGNEASQGAVEAADPKRFYADGDYCRELADPPDPNYKFEPSNSNSTRRCILGEGRGSGEAGDWNSIIRVRINSGGSLCSGSANDLMTFYAQRNVEIKVPYERCVFDTTSIPTQSATVFDFPIPTKSPWANGGGTVQIFLPDISGAHVGYWDFGPPDPIVAFMGGGFVAGTECVEGTVDPEPSSSEEIPVGPDQTFYMRSSGAVYLKRDLDYTFQQGDEVFSLNTSTGEQEGEAVPLKSDCYSDPYIDGFAQANDGCAASLPVGSGGSNLLMFRSHTGAEFTLGRMYETTANISGGLIESYSCSLPGPLPPDQPFIRSVEAHASGGMLVEFNQDGPGGDPTYYTYQMRDENEADNRSGTVVDEQGQNDISSPFVITPEPALTQSPWQVRIKAWNDAGESEWSDYSALITPSVEAPPVPGEPDITNVATGNGTATVSFTPAADNGVAITNYAYSLTRDVADPSGFEEFDPAITSGPFTLTGLNNGEEYTVSIAAINANGMGPDSAEESFTPGTQCEDITDWSVPQDPLVYFCSVTLTDYAFADFHILTTIGTDVCSAPANYLPTDDGNGQGIFCKQEGSTVRAIYDWKNGIENFEKHELTWLDSVQQIGSRSLEPSNDACGDLGTTVAGRCANQLKSGENAFREMAGAGGSAIANLDTSNLNNIEHIFHDAAQFNQNVSTKSVTVNNVTYIAWDVSGVDRINSAFWGATNFNNGGEPLYWDTGNVFNMGYTFAQSSFNQDISTQQVTIGNTAFTAWNTSQVRFLDNAFNGATVFNQDLSSWNTAKVETLENTFKYAVAFNNGETAGSSNQPLNWTTPNLTKLNYAFAYASAFNQKIFANGSNTAKVTNMAGAFKGATGFNQNIGGWKTEELIKTESTFEGATAFNQDIGSWSTGLVTNMNAMFKNAEAFNQDLSGWAIGKPGGDFADFDQGADAWCGLGFENQGRPIGFLATTQTCQLDLDLATAPTDIVEAGNAVAFTMKYSNDSGNDVTNGTLAFTLPDGTNLNAGQTSPSYSQANNTLTWTGVNVPAGSEGGERLVVVDVPTSFSGDTLSAEATLSAPSNTGTANKTASLKVGGDAVWEASLEAPNYVLAGDTLTYEITLENTGNRDGEVELTLSWDTDEVVPETTAGNCTGTPMTCSWTASVKAGGVFEPTLTVTAPEGTPTGAIVAELSVIEGNVTKDPAFARTEVDAQPDLAVTLRSLPSEMVGLNKNIAVEVIVQNKGTAAASEVNVRLPTSIAALASSNSNGSASGDDVVWPQIDTLLPNQSSVRLTAQLTAPGTAGAIQTEASVTGKSPGGVELSWESELITVQVADQAAPQLTARFVPATFAPGEEISLVFDYENFGSVAMSDATLSIPIPKDTAVASAPTGGSCTETVCTVSTGEVAAGAKGSQSVTLTVSESVLPERLAGSGLLRAVTVGEFQPQAATAEAEQQDTTAIKPPYELEITPPAGSGCTLASIGLQADTGVTGYTLVRDNLLHFSITGCDPEAEVEIPVAITVQGDPFPESAEAIKTDDNATTAAAIAGATVAGNTIRYTLKDNGPLDLDTDPGELRDPVSAAIAGGSGIYVPFIPVPIPYWVLGLLAGLMGWLGYRRLKAA